MRVLVFRERGREREKEITEIDHNEVVKINYH